VVWEGDFEGLHSLAMVNRAVCRGLLEREVDLGLLQVETGPDEDRVALDATLAARMGKRPAGGPAQMHVGHRWPPRMEAPPQGRWVLMQPWEYGSLPKAWLPMLRRVDEVWAYSRSVRDCYLEAGVPPERVHVVPLGVDPEVFRPGLESLPLPPGPAIRFLFVGGTIFRKGIDLLLTAFARAFQPADNVGLVISPSAGWATSKPSAGPGCTSRTWTPWWNCSNKWRATLVRREPKEPPPASTSAAT